MKLIMENWRLFLQETANREFLEEFQKIYEEWHDLQATYGPIHTGQRYDSDGNPFEEPEVQSVPIEDQPEYVKDAPKYYGHHGEHPDTRRATFSQTQSEVDIERKLMTLFQEFADQSFFQNDVTKYHDLSYQAAVHQPWAETDLKFADFSREDYLKMGATPGFVGKDVMSCGGSTAGRVMGSYGMILQGFTVFASFGDVGTQTLRTAHEKVKAKHASSGLPKRPSPRKIGSPKKELDRLQKRHAMLNRRSVNRGKDPMPELTRDAAIEIANRVILDASDMTKSDFTFSKSTRTGMRELLLANWTIEGWYFSENRIGEMPHPESFWRKAYELGVPQQVWATDPSGNKRRVYLSDYFEEEEEEIE